MGSAKEQKQKLLVGDAVEVRPLEEGLRGSWHAGVVIRAEHLCRSVEYKDFVTDEDQQDKYVERVQVTEAVEGLPSRRGRKSKRYRNRIRPLPPPRDAEERWTYGLCVDAFYGDGWWEGILLDDLQGSEERSVLFPDEGDALTIHRRKLRITQEWDEKEGTWSVRGHWVLATFQQDFERAGLAIGLVWYHLRQMSTFINTLGQWTAASGDHVVWLPYMKQVVRVLVAHPEKQTLPFVKSFSTEPMKLAYTYSNLQTSSSCMEVEVKNLDRVLANRADPQEHIDRVLCNALGNGAGSTDQGNNTIGREISQYCQSEALNCTLNCNLLLELNSNKKARKEIKMHLLALGWRLTFKTRPGKGKRRYDVRYVSPTGRIYYSLFRAFVGWKNEQKAQGLVDGNGAEAEEPGNCVLEGGFASLPLQKTGVRVTRNMLSSTAEFPRRSQRICSSSGIGRYEYNTHNTAENDEDASKILEGQKEWFSWSKRLHHHQLNKKRSGTCDMFLVPESTHRTKTRDFQSECFERSIVRNTRTGGAYSKKSMQGTIIVSGLSRKKHKHNLEDSLGVKRRRKSANGYRMQVLLSAPGESKDPPSGKDKRNVSSVLSWMIENDMVAENQRVHYFNSQKEGWITYEGILCACCGKVYSLTDFEAHAGSKRHRPSANIILKDGRSLLQCQMQVLNNNNRTNGCRAPSRGRKKINHDECMICHVGGHLVLCDHCPNSFHIKCINLENVPKQEKWHCPTCCCVICGGSEFNGDPESFTESTVLFCDQCECQYHVGCLHDRGMRKLDSCPEGNWFCSKKCSEMFSQLRNLVGVVNPVGFGGLSWTLLRSTEGDSKICDQSSDGVMAENGSKLSVAVSVMHECFAPMIETTTKKDIIRELIFNRGCDGNWLNFRGFYTMILQKEDDFVSVATVRIYGRRVAEMPLIGTRIKYRYQGMCRLLVKELEKLLHSLEVERLILPAVSELKQTWIKRFGFHEMNSAERFELLKHNFMNFPDTTVLQKLLTRVVLEHEIVTETVACQDGVEARHLSLRCSHRGLGVQKEIVAETVASTLKIRSYTEVAESVTPIRSLPFDIPVSHCNSSGDGFSDDKMKLSLLKEYPHNGSTSGPGENHRMPKNTIKQDVGMSTRTSAEDETIVGTTYSNRLVRELKWKIRLNNGRKNTRRRRQRTEESPQHKDVQFGACQIRDPDEEASTICSRTIARTAEGNCLSCFKESEPVFDGPSSLEGGWDHVAEGKVIEGRNSHTSCRKHCRENDYGHTSCLKSFKYCYSRRSKQICAGNGLSREMPPGAALPVKSSILHSNMVC